MSVPWVCWYPECEKNDADVASKAPSSDFIANVTRQLEAAPGCELVKAGEKHSELMNHAVTQEAREAGGKQSAL